MSEENLKHIKDAIVCLRQNNCTIPSELLEQFSYILTHYYSNKKMVIVPQESANFCAEKTLEYMQEKKASWGACDSTEALFLTHIGQIRTIKH